MKAETLERLRKEATEALSRHIWTHSADGAQGALAMLQVLTTLEGMTAEDAKPATALCLHGVYDKGTCLLPYRHTQDHDFTPGAGNGAGRLGHMGSPLGKSPFCAYAKCDNPPTTPGRYCGVHDDPNKAPWLALDPALAHQQSPNVDQHANIPSGQSMLLDGPTPTPKQVAHLRNEVLEEAAQDIEALKLIGAHDAARILRNLKGGAK